MTHPGGQLPQLGAVRTQIEALIPALIGRAETLGLTWQLRPGTVSGGGLGNTAVTLDGDTTPIRASSLIGAVVGNLRVMVLSIPPGGHYIIGYADAYMPTPGEIIAYGERDTSSSTTTTETEVLELDDVGLRAYHTYQVTVSNIVLDSTVANDTVAVRLRHTTDGTFPTTGSAIFAAAQVVVTGPSAQAVVPITFNYRPITSHQLRLLLTVARVGGTGSVSLVRSTFAFPIEITITHLGFTPLNTGTAA